MLTIFATVMHIPHNVTAASLSVATPDNASTVFSSLYALFSKNGKYTTGDWSSLIGIITAICGNVLISIALNTQRYAHIRLNKQYRERQRLVKRAKQRAAAANAARTSSDEGYGTASNSPVATPSKNERRKRVVGGYKDDPIDEEERPLLGDSVLSDATDKDDDEIEEGQDEKEGEEGESSYLRSPYWWAGIILMTVGEAGNFLAYGFAPASIVSPLGVVALISNCIIAPFFLKEPLRKRDALGVLIAVGGAVTVVLSADSSNPKLGPDKIWKLISTWEFETYLGVTIAMIVALMWASSRYGHKSILIDLGLVGLFGGYTALSTKGVASLLSYTVFQALTFPITYLLVAVLVGTAVMQIKYVNRALRRFDATQVIPTQFVMFTLSVIIGSAVLYRDFEKESAANAGKFVGGCALTFLGVYFITSARDKNDEDEDVLEEDEEAIGLANEGVYHDEPEHGRPSARRSSTAPLEQVIPAVNGYEAQPHTGSLIRTSIDEHLPHISRTSTAQSVSLLDSDASEPSSYADTSPFDSNPKPWIAPSEQTSAARESMQNLLRPLDNILPQSAQKRKLPSTLKSTTSEPILPMEATLPPRLPRTPPNAPHEELTITPHTPDGPHLLARKSSFIPGPFTSTLSSTLSAIVADSLRRGVDVKSLKPKNRRKRLPDMPSRLGGSMQPQRNNSETDAGISQYADDAAGNTEGDSSNPRRSRMRSLSNTLGDLFRSTKKQRTSSIGDDVDVENDRISRVNSSERDS